MIEYAVDQGRLHRVHLGVYAVGRPPSTGYERAMAAVLACGPTALLSHRWALWLYGIGRLPAGDPDVTVSDSREGPKGVNLHHSRRALTRDHSHGIPVTRPERALIDCIPLLDEQQLRRATSDVQVDGLCGVDAIREELERTRGRHIAPLQRLVSEDSHAITRSLLEDLLLDMSRANAWAKPAMNETMFGIEVDFSYPQWNLVIDALGYRFHGNKVAFEDDATKRLHLEANGVHVVTVTYDQMTRHLARTRAQLERVIDRHAR